MTTPLAKQYFENDFDIAEAEAAYRTRVALGTAAAAAAKAAAARDDAETWDQIFLLRGARQYRPRSFILLAFPEIAQRLQPNGSLVDLGCGAGASVMPLLPLLRSLNARATCVDFSLPALDLLQRDVQFDPALIEVAHANLTVGPLPTSHNHVALLVFVLSAVAPELQPAVLANAVTALAPGGLLLIRDYGAYDVKHTSTDAHQRMGDGSLRTFFTVEALQSLIEQTPSLALHSPARYLTVKLCNRKTATALPRVFVRAACVKKT